MEDARPGLGLLRALGHRRGGSQRLVGILSRYSRAIEYDLVTKCRGLRLAELWKTRQWRFLLNMIDHLPRDSAYMQAMVEDEELAERSLDAAEQPKALPVREMRDWSATVELLTVVADRIAEQTQVIAASGGAQPRMLEPLPRPRTARERVENRRLRSQHRRVVAMMLPHRADAMAAEQAAEDARLRR